MKKSAFFVMFLSVILSVGCGDRESRWIKAIDDNSIASYEAFLKHHPDGEHADLARLRLNKLHFKKANTERTIEAYEDFLKRYPEGPTSDVSRLMIGKLKDEASRPPRTLHIEVQVSYENVDDPPHEDCSLVFRRIAQILFAHAGYAAEVSAANPDADLSVTAKGTPAGAFYSALGRGSGGGFRYTGAEWQGVISVKLKGGREISRDFKGGISPPAQTAYYNNAPPASDPEHAPFFKALESSQYHFEIAEIVGALEGPIPLISATSHPHRLIRVAAIQALGILRDPRAVMPLFVMFDDIDVCDMAVRALGKISDARVFGLLVSGMKSAEVRYLESAIVETLGEMGDRRATDLLIGVLNDEISGAREEAAIALGKMKDERAVFALIAALKSSPSDGPIGGSVAWALGMLNKEEAVKPLIDVLGKDTDPRISEALLRLTGLDYGYDRDRWLKWWDRRHPQSPRNK